MASALRPNHKSMPPRHRLKNPFTMSKKRANPAKIRAAQDRLETVVFIPGTIKSSNNGGAYRDRTDDPLLAKQVLSQLS